MFNWSINFQVYNDVIIYMYSNHLIFFSGIKLLLNKRIRVLRNKC